MLLAELGLGTYNPTGTSTIFLGELPAEPEVAKAVTPYPGVAGNAKLGYDRPRMQIGVRGTQDYRTAADEAQAVYDALVGLRGRYLPSGTTWLALIAPVQSGPVWIPPGARDGRQFAVNVELHLHRPTLHRV